MGTDGPPAKDDEPTALTTTEVVGRGEELLTRAKALSERVAERLWRLCGIDRRCRER